jgi:hypothetical protein
MERAMKIMITKVQVFLFTLTLLLTSGCGKTPKLPEIPGVKGPLFNLMDGKVMVSLKLLKANLNVGAKVPIPKTKESFFEVSPNVEDGGTLVVFYLDVEDLKDLNIGVGDGNTLPDGRAIPGIPGGTLNNSLRVDTELLDLSFYFHKSLFGFFIPLGWNTNGFGGSWNIVIDNKNIGLLGAVSSDEMGLGAGIILFLRLEQLRNPQFMKAVELSRQNPHLVF